MRRPPASYVVTSGLASAASQGPNRTQDEPSGKGRPDAGGVRRDVQGLDVAVDRALRELEESADGDHKEGEPNGRRNHDPRPGSRSPLLEGE